MKLISRILGVGSLLVGLFLMWAFWKNGLSTSDIWVYCSVIAVVWLSVSMIFKILYPKIIRVLLFLISIGIVALAIYSFWDFVRTYEADYLCWIGLIASVLIFLTAVFHIISELKRPVEWSIWSLVLGLAGLVLFVLIVPVIFSILAIIFGIIALKKSNAGKGAAIAGIVLGGLWFVMIPLIARVAPGVLPAYINSILASRAYNIEMSVIKSLKRITWAEALWLAQDCDGNGIKDYWTYDVSCFRRMYRMDGETLVAFIPLAMAWADTAPAPYTQNDFFSAESVRIETWDIITPQAYNGYFFRVMLTDENGVVYNQKPVGSKQIPACNIKFAFVAYPAIYGTIGVNTYIVNEEGAIYSNDCGSDAKKIVLQWPGSNPAVVPGPSGKPWRVAD
ncbi:MAG TPA: DUF2950 family protein [Planctomycetota bacterium]|nr:DUF2950 family protein [Planctomycetota bacterium]